MGNTLNPELLSNTHENSASIYFINSLSRLRQSETRNNSVTAEIIGIQIHVIRKQGEVEELYYLEKIQTFPVHG